MTTTAVPGVEAQIKHALADRSIEEVPIATPPWQGFAATVDIADDSRDKAPNIHRLNIPRQ